MITISQLKEYFKHDLKMEPRHNLKACKKAFNTMNKEVQTDDKMNKTELINKITLLDTSIYRKIGFLNSGVYLHEPLMYRKKLYEVYEKLDIETLAKLLELKQIIK